ncbi:unnamed protein product [Allacma fusca]|uniref:PX domain-containing protein n=1 Tax=Allacma fusca TaxID=39272 RepID=A0A8J2L2W1_9HEXA|nr:unnamed protein product [Allacma fusca]
MTGTRAPAMEHVEPPGLLDPEMALEVIDAKMKRCIKVEVVEPVTITTRESFVRSTSFTSYHILIETDHWAFSFPYSDVRRRYSEFCWLRSKLQAHHPNKILPPLPPKRYFHMTKFDPKVIEERRYGLGKFIQRVMRSSELLSDAALHLFLQSSLSVEEIEEKLTEGVSKSTQRKSTRLTPYLLRSLSSGSSGSAGSIESDSVGERSDGEASENETTETVPQPKAKVSNKTSAKERQLNTNELVCLTITHEDTDEVVEVANSPLEPPILSSLIFNSATESSRLLQVPQPTTVQ